MASYTYYFRLTNNDKISDKIGTIKKHTINTIPAPAFSI